MNFQRQRPIDKAIVAVGGNQTILANKIGCKPQNITNIKRRGGSIPVKNSKTIDVWISATGLSKKELFPQFYKED